MKKTFLQHYKNLAVSEGERGGVKRRRMSTTQHSWLLLLWSRLLPKNLDRKEERFAQLATTVPYYFYAVVCFADFTPPRIMSP
jgi:hypothetical protein